MKRLFFFLALFILLLTSCGTPKVSEPPAYKIAGTWSYSMTEDAQQDRVYDARTISFSGTSGAGTYTLVNFYEEEYTGSYKVSNTTIVLTGNDGLMVEGSFSDDVHFSGTWKDTESSGSWTAIRE